MRTQFQSDRACALCNEQKRKSARGCPYEFKLYLVTGLDHRGLPVGDDRDIDGVLLQTGSLTSAYEAGNFTRREQNADNRASAVGPGVGPIPGEVFDVALACHDNRIESVVVHSRCKSVAAMMNLGRQHSIAFMNPGFDRIL